MLIDAIFQRTRAAAIMLALILIAFGCETPRTIAMNTLTDPDLELPEPADALVHMAIVRVNDENDARPTPIVERSNLSLPERNLLAHVERGARDAGFRVVSRSEAEFIFFCSSQTITGERQTYRRVPVYETTHGTIHTRRGWRTFHGTTTSDVVVPVTRPYAEQIITITAHELPLTDSSPNFDDASAIWMGRLVGEATEIEDVIVPAVAELLRSWGATDRRTVRVDQLIDAR